MNGLLELRLASLLWSGLTMWLFRAVAHSFNLSIRISRLWAFIDCASKLNQSCCQKWLEVAQKLPKNEKVVPRI